MVRMNSNKKSKYIVYVGWALQFFADDYNDIINIMRAYGSTNCSFKPL